MRKMVIPILIVLLSLSSVLGATLVSNWELNEISGTTAYDSSGNGNDAVLGLERWNDTLGDVQIYSVCEGALCPSWESGSLRFYGSTNMTNPSFNDYESSSIFPSNSSMLNFGSGNFTLVAWVKYDNNTYYDALGTTADLITKVSFDSGIGYGISMSLAFMVLIVLEVAFLFMGLPM